LKCSSSHLNLRVALLQNMAALWTTAHVIAVQHLLQK
jgi:hypothetical protein